MSWANEIGRIGEQMVADYLKTKGYIIFRQNYRTDFGEIDIIAESPDILLFVEVKTREENSLVAPADAVDKIKQEKILQTASRFLKSAHHYGKYRFDIAEVVYRRDRSGSLKFSLNYIQNAFCGNFEND
ncbi:MAG: YraN family protein [Ruminococcaceae bacterium]|nr:YraN family protein [Oscillospiraceae bacterium]